MFPSTFVVFPIGILWNCINICLGMGNLYAATPGQSPGVARYIYIIYIYIIYIYISIIVGIHPLFLENAIRFHLQFLTLDASGARRRLPRRGGSLPRKTQRSRSIVFRHQGTPWFNGYVRGHTPKFYGRIWPWYLQFMYLKWPLTCGYVWIYVDICLWWGGAALNF
jgi:hypothetical protein